MDSLFGIMDAAGGGSPSAVNWVKQADPRSGFNYDDFQAWLSKLGYGGGDSPWLKANGSLPGLYQQYQSDYDKALGNWLMQNDPNNQKRRQIESWQLNQVRPYSFSSPGTMARP